MASIKENNLELNYGWPYGESGWNSGMDENIVKLGFESRKRIIGILSSPPSSPSNGDAYIVGTAPTGLFSGKFANIAIYDRGSWVFIVPKNQEVVFNTSDGCDYIYNNGWSLKLEAEVSPYIKIKDFTFSTGYTITDQKQCLLNITDNHYYQWNGTIPKVVSAGSTPATSGGIGVGAWVDRTDAVLRNELDGVGGAQLVRNKLTAALASAYTIASRHSLSAVYPDLQFSADNTGATDATAKLQAAFDFNPNGDVIIRGAYKVSSLNLQAFKGRVLGNGVIITDGTTDIGLNMTGADGVVWDGPWLDMGHRASTGDEARCRYGFYLRDTRNCRITPKVKGVRRGYPVWVDGTSAAAGVGQLDSWGSNNIWLINTQIDAYTDDPDKGAQLIIKSDYYSGDGTTYVSGGNGVKLADFKVDSAVAYPATTRNIFILGGVISNCDRVGILNASHVYEYGAVLDGMKKRGFNVSPTCNNVHLSGGSIRGGESAVINFTLGCTQCSAGGKFIDPQGYDSLSGEATALRVFQGCRDIHFYDIRGKGGALRSLWITGSSDVTLDNVKLDANVQSETRYCIEIDAGLGGNTNSWVTSGIRIKNSQFAGKYAYAQNVTTGVATYDQEAVRVSLTQFSETVGATYAAFVSAPAVLGTFSFYDCIFSTTVFTLLNPYSHAFVNIRNRYGSDYYSDTLPTPAGITTDTLPDAIPIGSTFAVINGATSAPDASKQGMLASIKPNSASGFRKYIVQRYYPANNAGTEYKIIYVRRGLAASNAWSAWATITGV